MSTTKMKNISGEAARTLGVLTEIQKKHDLSEPEIAQRIGLDKAVFSHLRSGRTKVPSKRFRRSLKENFDVNESYLLTGEGEPFTSVGKRGVESPENEYTRVGMGRHLEWLTAHIDRLDDKIAILEGRGGPFAGDQEVIQAVESLDQTDYNTIRDLILGFAWWAKRYGTPEGLVDDDPKTQKPARV